MIFKLFQATGEKNSVISESVENTLGWKGELSPKYGTARYGVKALRTESMGRKLSFKSLFSKDQMICSTLEHKPVTH